MQIIINTTPATAKEYISFVYNGVTEDQNSGHYDAQNHWSVNTDADLEKVTEQVKAYLTLADQDAHQEAELAAYQAIETLLGLYGIPMPRTDSAQAEIYTEEEVLRQERLMGA